MTLKSVTSGLLYIGGKTVESAGFGYGSFSRLGDTRMSIFVLGERGDGTWNHPEVMPVYISDRDVRESRFLLCIAEGFYYTLLSRPEGEGRWRVFHSADASITRDMVAKLQERYQLQQRIG